MKNTHIPQSKASEYNLKKPHITFIWKVENLIQNLNASVRLLSHFAGKQAYGNLEGACLN